MIVTTESGTRYVFDGRKVTRLLGDNSLELAGDGSQLSFTFWGVPEVGKVMRLLFNADEYNGVAGTEYIQPMRVTTPVVSIQYDSD